MVSLAALGARFFGTSNERQIKAYQGRVEAINALEPELAALSDDELRARTEQFRKEALEGKSLDDLLVPAFATVREAAKRSLGQRHYDVQLIGGMVQHDGKISEMRTGEGKTLVATLPVYLNAIAGRGVHVVTVNDYLAERDAEWMGQVYRFLGLKVGTITNDMDDDDRRAAYAADVTYGTNNEFGFDYLRDNMKYDLGEMVQRGHYYAIVDEVDSILIDEARTPLIISGPVEDRSELYTAVDKLVPQLSDDHYEIDEKAKAVTLTDEGNEAAEELLRAAGLLETGGLYDVENVSLVHHMNNALRAHKLFLKDRDYIVKNRQVIIIDEFTGRMMDGRRYSDGLHQALEAKEGADIQPENQTLASITFQNYFRLYEKLAGMTGTAQTEAEEFIDIYGLEVVDVPTNKQVARVDEDDEVYRSAEEKFLAIIELIKDCRERQQPVLVGTTSIEKSELLSEMLKKQKVTHEVLNARHHEREAMIVADAGCPGSVTIATNMAGRGTDIQLGGNFDMRVEAELADVSEGPEREKKEAAIKADIEAKKQKALEAGGLYVVGTERHESRRIDNQLRGRSGRQGDPGYSKFFLSLDDDLMRIFGSDRMDGVLQKLGLEKGEAIIHPWINKALEKAQKKVEAHNYDIRKNLLKFDNVMNEQRKVIFDQRIELMRDEEVTETVVDLRHQMVEELVERHIPQNAYAEQWNIDGLSEDVQNIFNITPPIKDWAAEEGIADEEILKRLRDATNKHAAKKAAEFGPDIMRQVEKSVLLQTLDHLWRDHLVTLEHLRQVVGLRGYGQRDPLNEYQTESFTLFEAMLAQLREAVTGQLAHVELSMGDDLPSLDDAELPEMEAHHVDPYTGEDEFHPEEGGVAVSPVRHRQSATEIDPNDPSTWGKVARNQKCPCGSGKKYKQCHGALG
ncbi:MAG: protein translocase subunit SecA [Rhodomicrobium sp.]|nr:MAG: protein translocase subunit SecA [Rhodomicrobium sp.]